jgi:hypothetical protein
VTACPRCDTSLPDSFVSPPFFTTGEPVNRPKRPGNCRTCGARFPWNSKLQGLRGGLADAATKAWGEYKALSALQLTVLLMLLLILIGVFTWRDFAEILKGLVKK